MPEFGKDILWRLKANAVYIPTETIRCAPYLRSDITLVITIMISLYTPPIHEYRTISNISRTTSLNLNANRLNLQLSLHNILKSGVKSRMKM